jgi:hypothetical protein
VPHVHELAGGLWTLRTDDGLILFDPIAVPDEFPRDGNVAVVPGGGAMPDAWLESEWAKATREEYNEKLRPLLDLPVERLLPTHGDPVLDDAHDALRHSLF